jgi:hypothetical protein
VVLEGVEMSAEENFDDAFMERERQRVWDEAHEHYGTER